MSDLQADLPKERRMATWPSSDRCMFCKFWFDTSLSHGHCRRYPQEVLTEYMHFCGEFRNCDEKRSNNPKWKKKTPSR